MNFIIIKDQQKKQYYVISTPFLPEFYSIIKRKNSNRFKLKVFENNYAQRIMKIFYVKYLLSQKYKYRKGLLNEFLSTTEWLPLFKNKKHSQNYKKESNQIIPPEFFFKIKHRKHTKDNKRNNFLNRF